ncbi:MAG TPA: two-component regulator propeller domain-containing protein [Niabella sp.]|nr:two-component regulator propeller domain-containing protein [Niabella sp.]HQX18388.1 two-component regulator propeller domain-containing protein [Niabella sp.]HQX40120.1 two-component regulator propeller domain-containing protein [Niabella sp.]HRB34907.1 two-component regulator propeller domain-containing protein [Niabella sp.]
MRNNKRYIILALALLQIQICIAAFPVRFNYLTVEDGLSNSSVLAITQDSKGFIWLGTRDGLNRYDGKRIKVFRDFFKNNPKGPNVKVICILEDTHHKLWIGTSNGLYYYDPVLDRFTSILFHYVNILYEDKDHNIWIGTTTGLFMTNSLKEDVLRISYVKYDGEGKNEFQNIYSIVQLADGQLVLGSVRGLFTLQKKAERMVVTRLKLLKEVTVITMCLDQAGKVWIGTNNSGLYSVDTAWKKISHFIQGAGPDNILNNNVRKVMADRKGDIWIGTLKGLNRYSEATKQFDAFVHLPENPHSLNYNSIYDIFEDRQGSIWIGTYYGGANKIDAYNTPFDIYSNTIQSNSLSSNVISAIAFSPVHSLWVGTEAEGLNRLNLNDFTVSRFNVGNKKLLSSNLVKTIYRDNANTLWVGFFGGGLIFSHHEGVGFQKFTTENSKLNSNDVTAILEDDQRQLWVGHQDFGINVIDKSRRVVSDITDIYPNGGLPDKGVTCMFKDNKGNIFIGTRSGIYLYATHLSNRNFRPVKIFPNGNQKVYINCIAQDSTGTFWFGSSYGLSDFSLENGVLNTYATSSGLPANKVVGIVPDRNGNLWLSTEKGISKFDKHKKQFTNYDKDDGLPADVFNFNSFYKHPDGRVFFGSLNGLVSFWPSKIETNIRPPEIVLTKLVVNGTVISVGDSSFILDKSLGASKVISLSHDENDINISYAVVNFIKPGKNRSAYRLIGYDNDWVYTDDHEAVFRNLQPDKYTFLLKAANNDGLWNESQTFLTIKVLPPFWKTWWAYLIYGCLGATVLITIYRFLGSRKELQRKLYYEHELNLRQQELQKLKTDFFTHMSHELRTPLTLIQGPAEMMIDRASDSSLEKRLAGSIKSNAERLLNLTNNIMDFMKADSGAMKLNKQNTECISFSREIFDKFIVSTEQKNIMYHFDTDLEQADIEIDRYYMEIVLTNLLSNAIKFAPKEGKVRMAVHNFSNKEMVMAISDDGAGIPEWAMENLFEDFYQVNPEVNKQQGSGIGLALAKKIIELHGGHISYSRVHDDSIEKMTTCFTIKLKK